MNIKNLVYSTICLSFLFGCSASNNAVHSRNIDQNTSTNEASNLNSSSNNQVVGVNKNTQISGTYEATLPCASCPGIKQKLIIKNDNTFVLESVYLGNKGGKFIDKGTYFINKETIVTINQYKEKNYYKIKGSNLILLDSDQKEITGPLKDLYIFKAHK